MIYSDMITFHKIDTFTQAPGNKFSVNHIF